MNRRTFLQLLGLAPAVGLVAPLASRQVETDTLPATPEPMPAESAPDGNAIYYQDGKLYVGGQFTNVGGQACKIVFYNSATWNQLTN